MARSRLAVISILVFACASTAAATVVTLQGGDARAEICRFRAGSGDPFQRWLTSQQTTCVPSGSNIDFGPGLWNVFARSQNAVSTDPTLVDGATAPANIALEATPAATLTLEIPANQTAVIYAPRRRIAYPATERTTVPAGQELWVIALSKSIPVALTVVSSLDAGSTKNVGQTLLSGPAQPGTAQSGVSAPHSDVLAWIELPEPDRSAVRRAHGALMPHVRIASGTIETEASTLPPVEDLDGAIVLLPRVKAGPADLQLTGRGWLPIRRRITAGPHLVTLLHDPLIALASATLVVNWSTAGDLAALDRSLGSCDGRPEGPRFDLTISSCTPPPPGQPPDSAVCQVIRKESLDMNLTFGSVTIEDVPPGLYRTEIRYGKLPPIAVSSRLQQLQQRPVYLSASYLEAYGSLTRGGEALGDDARIEFPGGGIGFARRGSDYHAVLKDLPIGPAGVIFGGDSKIEVVACKGERTLVLAEEPMRRSARYDIDIPANSLTITVVDTFTRMTLPTASVRLTVMSKSARPPMPVLTQMLVHEGAKPGQDPGSFVIPSVPPDRQIFLQVKNSGYQTKDVAPFSVTKSEKKEVEVQLVPLSGSQGRIVSSQPFERAMVFWYSPQYGPTDRADLAADGTFFYDERSHMRDEVMIVVSSSHPLWIARAPAIERRKQLEIPFPDGAPVRETDVVVETTSTGMATVIGLSIGGLRVPQPVFAQYVALRGGQPYVVDSGPMHIPPVAETGPIEILRGPTVYMRTRIGQVGTIGAFDFGAPVASRPLAAGVDRVSFGAK